MTLGRKPGLPVGGGGGGGGTFVVAASNAPASVIATADYVCDGVADEVQINAAITALPSLGGSVRLSEGLFTLAAAVLLNKSAILYGAGDTFSATTGTRLTVPAGSLNGITSSATGVIISDLQVDELGANTGVMIDVSGYWTRLERVSTNGGLYGVRVSAGGGVIRNSALQGDTGLFMNDTGSFLIEGCYGYGTVSHAFHLLFDNATADGNVAQARFMNNWSDGNGGSGLYIDGEVSNLLVSGNQLFYDPAPSILVTNATGAAESVLITDNQVGWTNPAHPGIKVNNCDLICLYNNTIVNSGGHGVEIADSDNIQIHDNFVYGSGNVTNDTYSGIILDGDSNDCSVQGNRVKINTPNTNDAKYGIRIDDATCDNNIVINNDLKGSGATANFSDVGTGTITSFETHVLGPWMQDNVAASQTAAVLLLDGTRSEIPMPRAGSVVGITVYSNEARTLGTLTVDATVNGTVTGLTAVLDATNPSTKATTQAQKLDMFTAGQRIGVKITTDGTWAPTTADITVSVEVVLDGTANRS